jgi:hypothetical protein
MIKERLGILIATSLLCVPLCARAQGTTYTQGSIRNGYGGGYGGGSIGTTSSPPSVNGAAGSASIPSVNRNSMGTGQKPAEGALGLTPQLQKELGINRQQ